MTYDKLRENLMACEQNHINRYHKEEKQKFITFNAETINKEKELDEANNEGMDLMTHGVGQILRKRRQRPQQKFRPNDQNDDRCYHCGRPGHIRRNFPKLKKRNSCRNGNSKSLGAWRDEQESEEDPTEAANICFIAIGETSKVRNSIYPNYYNLQNTIDMSKDELQKVIDEYNIIKHLKKIRTGKFFWKQVKLKSTYFKKNLIMLRCN